jgi:curved DNA-binding protein CbpA
MATQRNHYAVLNVAPDAEPVVIEAAYRALMKKYHPDQGAQPPADGAPGAAEINNAFAILRDPQRRADYDHREWTRTQAIQLAQYQQTLRPPRPSNFFGWGGWLVALLLAGAIGIIASQGGNLPPLPKVEAAKAASLPPAELRSQPALRGGPVPPAELAEIQADALLGRSESEEEPAVRRARGQRPAAHPASRRHGARPARRSDPDFVERHGGIY